MLGTDPSGKGGVASVVSVYDAEGFFDHYGVRYLATHSEGSAGHKVAVAIGAWLKLAVALLRGKVSLVHAHTASRGSFMRKSVGLAMARAFGVPTIFHLHGAEFHKFADEEAAPWLRRWIRHTLERSTAVVALSNTWAQYLGKLAPGANVVVLANPVRLPAMAGPERAVPGRVLFLGRAEKRKGIFELVEAVAKLRGEMPGITVHVGGDGDLAAVQRHIDAHGVQQNVRLVGWLGPQDKQRELDEAEVFCLPSHDEGLPMAMLEAMAGAKAMVLTPVGGIPEAVRDGEQALLVPPGDADQLAAALGRALGDPALRQALGDAARQRVLGHYAAGHVLAELGQLYERLGTRPVVVASKAVA